MVPSGSSGEFMITFFDPSGFMSQLFERSMQLL
ncbi:thiamine biosynthesis protein ThiC [Synechococcus sp. WH 5701]|nr:thiamine biosynthesis protein ThiC [Synechococcus sp. WH 5701]